MEKVCRQPRRTFRRAASARTPRRSRSLRSHASRREVVACSERGAVESGGALLKEESPIVLLVRYNNHNLIRDPLSKMLSRYSDARPGSWCYVHAMRSRLTYEIHMRSCVIQARRCARMRPFPHACVLGMLAIRRDRARLKECLISSRIPHADHMPHMTAAFDLRCPGVRFTSFPTGHVKPLRMGLDRWQMESHVHDL